MKQQPLKQARKAKGLTLEQLAAEIGCAKSTLSRLERGMQSPMHDTAQRIERALGVRINFSEAA